MATLKFRAKVPELPLKITTQVRASTSITMASTSITMAGGTRAAAALLCFGRIAAVTEGCQHTCLVAPASGAQEVRGTFDLDGVALALQNS